MFSTAPASGLSSGAYAFHRNPHQLNRCPACGGGQNHMRTAAWRSSRGTSTPQEDQSCSAADWRPPKSGDQEDDGRLPSDKGNQPRTFAESTLVLRYDHLQSAPVVVLVYARSENHPRSLQHCCSPCASRGASSMAYCLSTTAHRHPQSQSKRVAASFLRIPPSKKQRAFAVPTRQDCR